MQAFSMLAKQKEKMLLPWGAGVAVAGAAYHFGVVPVALALLGTVAAIAVGGVAIMTGIFVIAGIQGSSYSSSKRKEAAAQKPKAPLGRF